LNVSKIFLYDEPAVQEIQISNLKNLLLETFPVHVEIRECIFNDLDEKPVEKISGCRIFDPKLPLKNTNLTDGKLILRKVFARIPN